MQPEHKKGGVDQREVLEDQIRVERIKQARQRPHPFAPGHQPFADVIQHNDGGDIQQGVEQADLHKAAPEQAIHHCQRVTVQRRDGGIRHARCPAIDSGGQQVLGVNIVRIRTMSRAGLVKGEDVRKGQQYRHPHRNRQQRQPQQFMLHCPCCDASSSSSSTISSSSPSSVSASR